MENNINIVDTDSAAAERRQIVTGKAPQLSKDMAMIANRGVSGHLSSVTRSVNIKAPLDVCFNLVARQLVETPNWDPIIRWVVPVSHGAFGYGSRSRVTFNLAGSVEEAEVVLSTFIPKRMIIWTSDHSNELKEQWQFRREPDGSTVVIVTISYSPYKGWFKHFNRWARMNGQIEKSVLVMLERLKTLCEIPELPKFKDYNIDYTSEIYTQSLLTPFRLILARQVISGY